MYTPSLPPPRNNKPPSSTHLHSPQTNLSDFEQRDSFALYLSGRDLAYSTTMTNLNNQLQDLQNQTSPQNQHKLNTHYRTLLEGQIEALKEMITALQDRQKEHTN